jgi:hypothetical protein
MAVFEELLALTWPAEFIVEYANGAREKLLRGEGVCVTSPADDPEGYGALSAGLPKNHPNNQKQCGRWVRLSELRAVYSVKGTKLWPAT